MRKFYDWFTPERRQLIQVFAGTLATFLVMFGFGTSGVWEQVLIIVGAVIGAIAALLNLINVRIADWATKGWAIVRAAIYTLAATVSPAFVLLGFYNEDVNTIVMTGISQGITVLSAAIAIFANGQQQKVALITEIHEIRGE